MRTSDDNNTTGKSWENIVFCRADGSYTRIFFEDGKKTIVTQNLGKVLDQLSETLFVRCHHSYLINLRMISHVDLKNKNVILKDEFNIPISRRKLAILPEIKSLVKEM